MNPLKLMFVVLALLPMHVLAHAFDDRYDLPMPLGYFMWGSAAIVFLTFGYLVVSRKRSVTQALNQTRFIYFNHLARSAVFILRVTVYLLFLLTIFSGLWGTQDSLMNISPTMIWIVAWVGLSLAVSLFGNFWPFIDPWYTTYRLASRLLPSAMGIQFNNLSISYPVALAAWPAVGFFLGITWIEVVYPQAAVPYKLSMILIYWSVFYLIGIFSFGPVQWRKHVDMLSIYFDFLGRISIFELQFEPMAMRFRSLGQGLLFIPHLNMSKISFILAMLSSVLFDGLMGGDLWFLIQKKLLLMFSFTGTYAEYIVGTIGLMGLWLFFVLIYYLVCLWSAHIAGVSVQQIMMNYAGTLIPIAIAYVIAHNASHFVQKMQMLIPLASDPMGWHWNLFNTVDYRIEIGLIDAQYAWYIALCAIVTGHMISIVLAHQVALKQFSSISRVLIASLPMAVLMIFYTAFSLSVIAEPMVKFESVEQAPAAD